MLSEGMAQLINHLLCKYEDLRMMGIPIIHIKTWEFQHTPATLAPWSGNRQIPGACGPGSPGYQRAPASVRDLGLENNVESNRRKDQKLTSGFYRNTHAKYTLTNMHMHTGMHPQTHSGSYKGVGNEEIDVLKP